MIPTGISASTVAEVQGLYGAFSFPEKLLQKIWLRGDFERAGMRLSDGRRLRVVHPGKWNLLGGPDFTNARLCFGEIGEREVVGDVEVHLRAEDWNAHGHARDPAYDRVVLHVVLFPPDPDHVTCGGAGCEIPVVALLPLLHCALEEFAADEAVEFLANRPLAGLTNELGTLPAADLVSLLLRHGRERWRAKMRYARLRVERLGWDAACHHAALEILGYRFNRAPMLRLAGQFCLADWSDRKVSVDAVFAAELEGWSLQGVRPANHPRTRLRQYSAWVRERPDWPAQLLKLSDRLPVVVREQPTPEVRRRHQFTALREAFAREFCGGAVSGPRLNTLVCDGLLPLLAVQVKHDLEGVWQHWFCGDLPPWLTSGLRQLGFFDGRSQPACHGAAQGLLGWFLERENRR